MEKALKWRCGYILELGLIMVVGHYIACCWATYGQAIILYFFSWWGGLVVVLLWRAV